MSGVSIIRALLVGDAANVALVPKVRIAAGVLPKGTKLPAQSIETVTMNDRNIPAPGGWRHVSELVRVTGLASTYPQLDAVMKAQKKACADRLPTIAGLRNITVHTAGAGPDFMDEEASIYMRSQTYRVTYSEAR